MPTYEYACTRCGQHVEVFQRFNEESLTTCGLCGGDLRKVFHPAGILFKGSGFYSTDNRSKDRTAAEARPASGTGSSRKPDAKTSEPSANSGASESSGASSGAAGAKEKSA